MEGMRRALLEFTQDVEAAGGVFHTRNGTYAPVGAPDWPDLAMTYIRAVRALGLSPVIQEAADVYETLGPLDPRD